MPGLYLPCADRTLEFYRPGDPRVWPARTNEPPVRIAYAAAHVVADPLADGDPWIDCAIDWDATLGFRLELWKLGLGVAEAMDTAQRGMGLDWTKSLELIARSIEAARDVPGATLACGCGTDQIAPENARSLDDVIRAYEEQMSAIESLGGRLILMASRALARVARDAADYEHVYQRLLSQAREPVILHWLGDMFDPALRGYWGSTDLDRAMETALGVITQNAGKIDGIKISLLDQEREIAMRRRLPVGVRMYTGDDFNFPQLIAADGFAQGSRGQSDALLGIFDAIAPAASAALDQLAAGHTAVFHEILEPCLALSRHIFAAPTRFYKTGIVLMAYLNDFQDHFTMIAGQQSARSVLHCAQLFRLADRAGLLRDPELATRRMQTVLAMAAGTA